MLWLLQVPQQIFITDKLPKGATGKIQRRNMVGHFITGKAQKDGGHQEKADAAASGKPLHQSKL